MAGKQRNAAQAFEGMRQMLWKHDVKEKWYPDETDKMKNEICRWNMLGSERNSIYRSRSFFPFFVFSRGSKGPAKREKNMLMFM
jgi:hypothetical protein